MDSGNKNPLSPSQQETLDRTKISEKMKDERYLRDHPELERLIGVFVEKVCEAKPANVLDFAGDFFTNEKLGEEVQKRGSTGEEKSHGLN